MSSSRSRKSPSVTAVLVTVDNYNRAQSDSNFWALMFERGGFGQIPTSRELVAPDKHGVIRPNRDTL